MLGMWVLRVVVLAQEQSTPATLQEVLDAQCEVWGSDACKSGSAHYCNVQMYARYDIGTSSQKTRSWRCYSEFALSFDVSGEGCVDNCGEMTTCLGSVVGSSSAHLSRDAELQKLVDANKEAYCTKDSEGTTTEAPTPETVGPTEESSPASPPSVEAPGVGDASEVREWAVCTGTHPRVASAADTSFIWAVLMILYCKVSCVGGGAC